MSSSESVAKPASLEWHKLVAGPHRSARASDPLGGYYAIHKSGEKDITTYHMYPFYRLGTFPSVKEAIEHCQKHYDERENANGSD